MQEYTITTYAPDSNTPDIVSTTSPITAIDVIQDAREKGYTVEYTGDPFADFARLALADEEG